MSFADTIKNIFVAPNMDEDYETEEELTEASGEEPAEEPSHKFNFSGFNFKKNTEEAQAPAKEKAASTASEPERTMNIRSSSQLRVVLVKPATFDEGKEIADQLLENNTVLLNLENADKDEARRLLDFLMGVVYAQKGKVQPHGKKTVILAPNGVEIKNENLYNPTDSDVESMI